MKLLLAFFACVGAASAIVGDIEFLTQQTRGCAACQTIARQSQAIENSAAWLAAFKESIMNDCPKEAPCDFLAMVIPATLAKMRVRLLEPYCTADTCTANAAAFDACSSIDEAIKDIPEVVNLLKDVCNILPGSLSTDCVNFMNQFLPNLQQGIIGILNDVKKLLNCPTEFATLQRPILDDNSQECVSCKAAVLFIGDILSAPNAEDILTRWLEQQCATLPSPYNTECKQTVDGGIGPLVQHVKEMLSHLCTDYGACATPSTHRRRMGRLTILDANRIARLSSGSEVCQAFQNIYNDVPNLVDKFQGVCDVIPTQYQAGCKNLFTNDKADVIKMADEAVVFMAQHIPFVNCQINTTQAQHGQEGYVPTSNAMQHGRNGHAQLSNDAQHVQDGNVLTNNAMQHGEKRQVQLSNNARHGQQLYVSISSAMQHGEDGHVQLSNGGTRDDAACAACKGAMGIVEYLLGSPMVKDALEQVLEGECAKLANVHGLGPNTATACENAVASSFDSIFKFVDSLLDDVCSDAVSGCTNSAQINKIAGLTDMMSLFTQFNANEICQAFQNIYDDVPNMINKFAGVCGVIPQQYQDGCRAMFTKGQQQVITIARQVVVAMADRVPFAHCSIGVSQVQRLDAGCDACKGAIDVIDTVLTAPLLQDLFGRLLDKLCAELPADLQAPCDGTVSSSLKAILNFVASMLKDICPAAIPGCNFASKAQRTCTAFAVVKAEIPRNVDKLAGVCDVLAANERAACTLAYHKDATPFVAAAGKIVDWLAERAHC